MKSTVAVIGIENEKGKEIAKFFSGGNCRLLIYSDDYQVANTVLGELKIKNPRIDAEIIDCKVTATWEADVIIMAVPEEEISRIAGEIKDVVCQKTIILPVHVSAEKINVLLPYCKVVTIEENWVVSGKDNEAVESIISILQNAA